MNKDVFITGIGFAIKYGNHLEQFWKELCQCSWEEETIQVEEILSKEQYDRNYRDYFYDILIHAILDAASDANLDLNDSDGCIIIGTGMGLGDAFYQINETDSYLMSQIKEDIKKKTGWKATIIVISNSCCSGSQAIAYGKDLLVLEKFKYVISGGVEAYSKLTHLGFQRLAAIDSDGCKPFDQNRKGISVGDGACFFAMQCQRREHVYCRILSYAVTNDAYHVVAPKPDGKQIKAAILQALLRADKKAEEIDAIVAHGTGTRWNDQVEAEVLYDIFGHIDVTAPKGRIGHTGGASGAFGLLTAIGILKHQQIPPVTHLNEVDPGVFIHVIKNRPIEKTVKNVMVDCFGFGGTNVALICDDGEDTKDNILRQVDISYEEYLKAGFALPDSRTMDEFCKLILYTVQQLFQGDYTIIDHERTGLVISTGTGAFTSLQQIGTAARTYGYRGINPSFFPNVMLSTAISRVSTYLDLHGPVCAFYDKDFMSSEAMEYCQVQLQLNNCDAVIFIMVDDQRRSIGKFLGRTIVLEERQ